MLKENISLTQLFTFIVNLLLGSSIVVGIGKDAQQNGWIAILIATLIGVGLMFFYFSLIHLQPNKNLYEIMEYCFTRKVTIILSSIYVSYFLYISARVLRTFGEMITAAIMPQTPLEVIVLSLLFILAYILYLGIEVLGRVSEILSPYIYFSLLFLLLFLPLSGNIQLNRLLPVMGDGFKPVLKAVFPSLLSFPFGELIVFTIILSSINDLKKVGKISLIAVLTAGLQLIIGAVLMIITLGADVNQFSNFPLLSTARLVAVGEFAERLDPLVVFIMILGVIIKSALFLYCCLKGLEYIFRLSYHYFAFPISILTAVFTLLIAANYGEHLAKGHYMLINYFHMAMQLLIPGITFIFLITKVRKQKSEWKTDAGKC
ncbi:GerAB/ArcD/ProY family transporter [Bacillus benzoevorans]|uniref:Spore germination protein KB n=1 Tax=Bacillus benzoevorans TaxID=1456 RepID=A0A7X0LWQ4_9BACI|nr:GerAB/ArcD/ProY family transporter [Bacillus benzoevorans]MBB6447326.1 spore germination protein KB [Bacillus benzoevorans]